MTDFNFNAPFEVESKSSFNFNAPFEVEKKGLIPTPAPRKEEDRTLLYALADNVLGIDDGVDTFGEGVGRGITNIGKTAGDIAQGVGSGIVAIPEGVAGLATTLAIDAPTALAAYATGKPELATDVTSAVTRGADAIREATGLTPEGTAGKVTEGITQFVVPAFWVLSLMGKANKVARSAKGLGLKPKTKLEKAKDIGWTAAAMAGTEFAVSTDGTTTLSDFVMGKPAFEEAHLIGKPNREKTGSRIWNRLKLGAEAGLLSGAFDAALGVAGTGLKAASQSNTAAKVKASIDKTQKNIDNLILKRMLEPDTLSGFRKGVADAIAFTRYRGRLPSQAAVKRLLMDGQIQNQLKSGERVLKNIDREIKQALNKMPEGSVLDRVQTWNKIDSYLLDDLVDEGGKIVKLTPEERLTKLDGLTPEVKTEVIKIRNHIDELSKKVLDSDFLTKGKFYTANGKDVKQMIKDGIGTYIRRNYRIYTDKKYKPKEQDIKAADSYFKSSPKAVEKEMTELARGDTTGKISDSFLARNNLQRVGAGAEQKIVSTGPVTVQAARKSRENFLDRHSILSRDVFQGGRIARDKLETGFFVEREQIPKTLRALLGETRNSREAYLSTVADLSQFSAVDDYFKTMADLADSSPTMAKLFQKPPRNPDGSKGQFTDPQKAALRKKGFVELGGEDGRSMVKVKGDDGTDELKNVLQRSGWGQLDGYFVPQQIYNDLTRHVLTEEGFTGLFKKTFGLLLKGKAISQYSKTILSPITQIRNFLTASMFAMANGNMPMIARGTNLNDVRKMIFADIANKGEDEVFAMLQDAQKRGLLGTNAELREIQDTLNKGLNLDATERYTTDGITQFLGKTMGDKVKQPFTLAENIYQGSDNFWKVFSWQAEIGKINKMLLGVDRNQAIAYLTKNNTDVSPAMASRLRQGAVSDDTFEELIKDRAAQIVRDTVPNYDKASTDLVRSLRRLPVGNFIVFPLEIYRTSFNIMRQSIDDMASNIPAVRNRGQQRMLGFIGTTIGAGYGLKEMSHAISGVSHEEMDAYQRSFGATWEKGATLIPIGKDENGNIQYFNWSISNPYDTLGRAAVRFLKEVDTAREQGKTADQFFTDVMLGTAYEFIEPFASESIITSKLLDVSIRQGRSATGAEIWDPTEPGGTKFAKGIAHVLDSLIPNASPIKVKNINPFSWTPSEGGIEAKPFTRGVLANIGLMDPKDKMGREKSIFNLASSLMGVTPLEFQPEKGLEFAGYRLNQARNNARSQFNTLTDDANVTSSQLLSGFRKANEAKLRVDREYYQMIEDLRGMGMRDSKIRKVLKDNNIGGYKAIMRGKFEPFDISEKNKKELRSVGKLQELPRAEINKIRSSLRNLDLKDPFSEPKPIQPVTPPKSTFDFNAPFKQETPPKSTFDFNAPFKVEETSTNTQAVVPTLPTTQANVNPSLLDNNPANLQIAQRLGRA